MNERKSWPRRIFGFVWGVVVGIYRTVIIVTTLLALAMVWVAFRGGPPVKIENNVALVIAPTGELVEEDDGAGRALIDQFDGGLPKKTSVRDLVEALDGAAKDSRISVAVLKLDDLNSAGMPQIEEVNAALKKFRAAGKHVYAYGSSYDQAQYLLATGADEIALDPIGVVLLTGFGVYTNYFKDALDKLGVTVNVFRVGEYKSAVEPFERNEMSPEARSANEAWLKDLWKSYNDEVASARKLQGSPGDSYVAGFATGLQKYNSDASAYAKASGLVDTVETLAQFRKRVGAKVGMDEDIGSFRQVHFADYLHAERESAPGRPKSKIALITVEGDIVDGEGSPGNAGGDSISNLIDSVRRDDDVAAMVLRVNSPGGSVTASEKIRRSIEGVQESGTPVVVSMSNLAASGGYWISMGADEIWAHDSTITGSIGIFGLWPTVDKPLDKLGIHTDGVGTTPMAGAMRIDRPLSPELRTLMQTNVEFGYRQFISGVSKGRDLPADQVEQIARGRVWSGLAAKRLGLVDEIGGLQDAVKSAADLAGLKEGGYQLSEMKPQRGLLQEFFDSLAGDSHARSSLFAQLHALKLPAVDDALAVTEALQRFNDPRGMYAYCFCSAAAGGH